jgi:ankyrin repeat protein
VRVILEEDSSLVHYHNDRYVRLLITGTFVDLTCDMLHQDALLTDVKPKSIYCAECYQRIQQKPIASTSSTLKNSFSFSVLGNDPFCCSVRGYVCDWPKHRRSVHKHDMSADICCCDTPSGDLCNWMVCPECFIISSFELKATHQLVSKKEGFTPLIVASSLGYADIVDVLLQYGADTDEADPDGVTALHAAASMGHADVLARLLDAGDVVNAQDCHGRTALQRAVEVEAIACVEMLLTAGADVHLCDNEGATLLHAAASVGHAGLIRLFLEAGLDPNTAASDGDTPLHWLPKECRAPALNLLLDAGAVVDTFDKEGMSPLTYATMRDNPTLVRLLLRAGASMEIRAVSGACYVSLWL